VDVSHLDGEVFFERDSHTKGTDFSSWITKATENDFSNLGFDLIGDHLEFSKNVTSFYLPLREVQIL